MSEIAVANGLINARDDVGDSGYGVPYNVESGKSNWSNTILISLWPSRPVVCLTDWWKMVLMKIIGVDCCISRSARSLNAPNHEAANEEWNLLIIAFLDAILVIPNLCKYCLWCD